MSVQPAQTSGETCILVPVYHPYRWMAPWMARFLEKFWPDHPPLFLAGLTSEEAGDLPHIPCGNEVLPRNWAEFSEEACQELRRRGFTKCYFIGEDHLPLGLCHGEHLAKTLPSLMDRLSASYLGLLGWDNRRQLPRNPVTAFEGHQVMRLLAKDSPRFHIHPCLFRLDVLEGCLAYLRTQEKQTPHGFEKACDKADAKLPEEWKQGCYQIKGEEFAANRPGALGSLWLTLERFYFHRMMGLYPLMRKLGYGEAFWRLVGFENFFYQGPIPMFYSGIMVRGKASPFFVSYVEQQAASDADFRGLADAIKANC